MISYSVCNMKTEKEGLRRATLLIIFIISGGLRDCGPALRVPPDLPFRIC